MAPADAAVLAAGVATDSINLRRRKESAPPRRSQLDHRIQKDPVERRIRSRLFRDGCASSLCCHHASN